MHKESKKNPEKQEPKKLNSKEPRHIKQIMGEWLRQGTQTPDLTRFMSNLLGA